MEGSKNSWKHYFIIDSMFEQSLLHSMS